MDDGRTGDYYLPYREDKYFIVLWNRKVQDRAARLGIFHSGGEKDENTYIIHRGSSSFPFQDGICRLIGADIGGKNELTEQ